MNLLVTPTPCVPNEWLRVLQFRPVRWTAWATRRDWISAVSPPGVNTMLGENFNSFTALGIKRNHGSIGDHVLNVGGCYLLVFVACVTC